MKIHNGENISDKKNKLSITLRKIFSKNFFNTCEILAIF